MLTKETETPKAILETHSVIPNQRALAVTLAPKFSLPPSRPEIIFVVDRSGSMSGKIPTLISALKVFLKSLPVGIKFNIYSFGSSHSFLWSKSKAYAQDTLLEAFRHIEGFKANMGGTNVYGAVEAAIQNRLVDWPCEIMLLTDGDIWNQNELFQYLHEQTTKAQGNLRLFSLGVGGSVSHALIEGVARAGNGFAQVVTNQEKLDKKVVKMLKGCLSPHITDYTLEINYGKEVKAGEDEDDFELVEKVTDCFRVLPEPITGTLKMEPQQPISLYDPNANLDRNEENLVVTSGKDGQDRYAHLPTVPIPSLLQVPHKIPSLFPFTRTAVYLIMSPQTIQKTPTSVVLKATSPHGPLQLEIPVDYHTEPGETIHQLAARKAVQGLEETQGWLCDAKDENNALIKDRFSSKFDEIVRREAVRLGVEYQVGGKWCSFVAVADNDKEFNEEKAAKRQTMKSESIQPG